jgi:MerR family transcriptional regulator, light-induced transcriptional regulator
MTQPMEPDASASEALLDALIRPDAAAAEIQIRNLLDDGVSGRDIYGGVIAPALARIGDLWAEGAISVAEEHFASAVIEQLMSVVYPTLFERPARTRERVLTACVEGERHVIGLRMAADLLEGAGFDVFFVGADTPIDSLAAMAIEAQPAVCVLVAKMPATTVTLAATVAKIQSTAPQLPLIAGGVAPAIREVLGSEVVVIDQVDEIVASVENAVGSRSA